MMTMRWDLRDARSAREAEEVQQDGTAQPHGEDCRRQAAILTPAEQLLLWGMRTYVGGLRIGMPVMGYIRRYFDEAMAGGAVEPLEATMLFLKEGAARSIEVKCPRCPAVTADEQILLRLAALGQVGDDVSAIFLARELLTPGAARVAGPVFRMLGASLLQAGLRLPVDQAAAAPQRRAPRALLVLPERETVH